MAALLSLNDLSCARGGWTILSGVSIEVNAGEAVVLRGPNGSGKTTLLRTIAGLQPAAEGTVTVDAEDVVYGAHADGVKGTLTVAENLEFWAALYGTGAIDPALAAFDLGPLRTRMARALSAGQRRRLGLARLLVTGRKIWALDEPTVSLDAQSVALFASAVRAHLTAGGAALIATHIDLGLDAREVDVTAFQAKAIADEAFL